MKRMIAMILAAALLSGCGAVHVDSSAEEQVSQMETWGVSVEEPEPPPSTLAEAEPSAVEANSAMESALEPEPTPEPTPEPEPPESLWDLAEGVAFPVWLDGVELTGLYLADTPLVRVADVQAVWPEFSGLTEESPDSPGYYRVAGWDAPLSGYPGGQGIHFQGQTEEYWLPITQIGGARSSLWDGEQQTWYLSSKGTVDTSAAAAAGARIPVLMYHAVSDDMWGIDELFVSPANMRAQLQYLVDNGYDPIFFSDLSHIEDYDRPIILTFDDGYDDNYNYLYPMLQEFGVKATIFVITGMMGDEHYFTAEQAKEMSDSGLVDIQSHTVDHDELGTLSYEAQQYQLSQSRLEIARITKRIPYVLAYPSGSYNSNTLTLGPEYYQFGLRMNGGDWYVSTGADNYEVTRTYVSRYSSMEEFMRKAA